MNHELRPSLTVEEWIKDRHANCLRIAKTKPEGYDKAGWLEDAEYLQLVADRFQKVPANREDITAWTFDNLVMMIRRMIWTARKQTDDTSMKALAGQAAELLARCGLPGSPLRDDLREANEP